MSKAIAVPGCKGTTVQELGKAGDQQVLLVNIEPGGEVPVHTHECEATMLVVSGTARKLSGNGRGEMVKQGDLIHKQAREPHGFTEVGKEGFSFFSLSGNAGIVHDGQFDMAFA